jgi:serine/threonine-protein kinase
MTVPMALSTRMWSAGKVVLLVVALVATYLLFGAASMRVALRAGEVQIPDLTNRTAREATALAADLGLAIAVDATHRPDPRIAEGRIIAQDPPAQSVARRRRRVRVWLSSGQRVVRVPAVTGGTERAANMRIAEDGLQIATVSEIRSQAYPSDSVVAQNPEADAAGERVALLVSRGEQAEAYVMPDLIGVNGDRAAQVLRSHGFRVAVVASTPYPGLMSGIVLRQGPQAGFQITPGEAISIEVSR